MFAVSRTLLTIFSRTLRRDIVHGDADGVGFGDYDNIDVKDTHPEQAKSEHAMDTNGFAAYDSFAESDDGDTSPADGLDGIDGFADLYDDLSSSDDDDL